MKRIYVLALALLITAPSSLFADYSKALDLYKAGDYMKSIYAVAEVLNIDNDNDPNSENYQLRFLAAHCHWRLGNYDKAMIHFRKAAVIKPDSLDPTVDMALLNLEAKRYSQASSLAKAVLEKDAKNITASYVLAGVAYGLHDYATAQKRYETIVAADPEHYASYNGLGKVFMAQKKYRNAETAFSTALALKSNSAELYNNLAICYYYMKKNELAKTHVSKAVALAPNNKAIVESNKRISAL